MPQSYTAARQNSDIVASDRIYRMKAAGQRKKKLQATSYTRYDKAIQALKYETMVKL